VKELETNPNNVVRTEINVKKKQEVEHTLEGTIKPKKGHKVWEINEVTGVIRQADYKVDTVVYENNITTKPIKKINYE